MNELPKWSFKNNGVPHDGLTDLPLPPSWRHSSADEYPVFPAMDTAKLEAERARAEPLLISENVVRAINAALLLRRPLLVTGKPGIGKSSIISRVAYELKMGPVLRWPISSRSTVKRGLYEYDALARLQAQQNNDTNVSLGDFIRLGPLGTALYPRSWPRALLIDEIDKGDIDLPNDLLNVLEEGKFEIEELKRAKLTDPRIRPYDDEEPVVVPDGVVKARQFPFIILTSNGEREFPAPLLRRCIRINVEPPTSTELATIVRNHLKKLKTADEERLQTIINKFVERQQRDDLANDQLLNAAFAILRGGMPAEEPEFTELCKLIFAGLNPASPVASS